MAIDEIVKKLVLDNGVPIVDWQDKANITGKMLIEIGDYFIDDVKDKYNLQLSFEEIDDLADRCVEVAKVRYRQ